MCSGLPGHHWDRGPFGWHLHKCAISAEIHAEDFTPESVVQLYTISGDQKN